METLAEPLCPLYLSRSSHIWVMLLDMFKDFLQWAFLIFRFIDQETEAQGLNYLRGAPVQRQQV